MNDANDSSNSRTGTTNSSIINDMIANVIHNDLKYYFKMPRYIQYSPSMHHASILHGDKTETMTEPIPHLHPIQ